MRSSSGEHFVALDHLRAFAAFLVFAWHFLHYKDGTPVSFEGAPALIPLALFDEGHTGVALFMVLSGYLFAKLLDGKEMSIPAFLWNRFVRLAPLLFVVFILAGIQEHLHGRDFIEFFRNLYKGLIYPSWPNGGWSITTEIHFYILLPLLILLSRYSRLLPIVIIILAIIFRFSYFQSEGEVQSIAYSTILGRIDQFTLGLVAFNYAPKIAERKYSILLILISFTVFWWWFDKTGGFFLRPSYPSNSPVWIVIPTIEAVAYSCLIAWYDSKKINSKSLISKILQRYGEFSYSIYLLHFFVVFEAAQYIDKNIMNISNFYICLCWALVLFCAMLLPGYLSFKFIENPFLRFRVNYIKPTHL
jgi:peptidoglycan/LPS O-acetylase OafA/YrhL